MTTNNAKIENAVRLYALTTGPKSFSELAEAWGLPEDRVKCIVGGMVSQGLVLEATDAAYLNPRVREAVLVAAAEEFKAALASLTETHNRAFSELLELRREVQNLRRSAGVSQL